MLRELESVMAEVDEFLADPRVKATFGETMLEQHKAALLNTQSAMQLSEIDQIKAALTVNREFYRYFLNLYNMQKYDESKGRQKQEEEEQTEAKIKDLVSELLEKITFFKTDKDFSRDSLRYSSLVHFEGLLRDKSWGGEKDLKYLQEKNIKLDLWRKEWDNLSKVAQPANDLTESGAPSMQSDIDILEAMQSTETNEEKARKLT